MRFKVVLTVATLLMLFSVAAFCGNSTKIDNSYSPWIDATGGPDAYGYKWADSNEDTLDYSWIDITTIGTQVTGLGDDNYVGPFNIGFPFMYYWYDVSQVYIGSNGYLKIPPPANIASTFPASIPLTAAPNDFMALYTMDLIFGVSGTCYYYTNFVDQFIVSFIGVPCWSTGGSHTFQAILDGNDNTITVNYGAQQGTTQNNDIIIGIENNNGQVGLLHSVDTYMPSNFTVKYYRPLVTPYQVHDLAIADVVSEGSKAVFILQNNVFEPTVWVKNVGNQIENGTAINCRITNASGATVYNQTLTSNTLNPGDVQEMNFLDWTAATVGQYSVTAGHSLPGDMNTANNSKVAEVEVVVVPGELSYDDNIISTSQAWNGDDGGYGMFFESPVTPAIITMIKYYIGTVGAPNTFTAQIIDDDGPTGFPGTILFTTVVNTPTANTWYSVPVNPPVVVEDGSFFGVWEQMAASSDYMGLDQTPPFSRQTWEHAGGTWAPYREIETNDAAIRVTLGAETAPVSVTLTPVGLPIQIPAGGGTFNFNIGVANNGTTQITADIWSMATLPNGSQYGPIIFFPNLTMNAGWSGDRDRNQAVPASAPAGAYTYNAYIGIYPGTVYDEDHFDFTKSADFDGSANFNEWTNWGEDFADILGTAETSIPVSFATLTAYPNPFNPSTNITYNLPETGNVRVAVFDISGRLVDVLFEGVETAGMHNLSFNAQNLSSGVYFCQMKTGSELNSIKMLLIK